MIRLRSLSLASVSAVTVLVMATVLSVTSAQEYTEAPMLNEAVVAGEIPTLTERIPTNPLVLDMAEIGKYGGPAIRIASIDDNFGWKYNKAQLFDYCASFGGEVCPGLVANWEWNEAGNAITMTLRENMRWSDGEIFDADDIMWWWTHIATYTPDPEGAPLVNGVGGVVAGFPGAVSYDGQPLVVEKLDNLTTRWTATGPNPAMMHALAYLLHGPEEFPEQYLGPLHPENQGYADDDVDSRVTQWAEHFGYMQASPYAKVQTAGYPTMHPYMLEERTEGSGSVYVRNPYYWAVDAEGKQLPYIDRIEIEKIDEYDLRQAKLFAGELDLANTPTYNPWRLADLPTLLENQERGDYIIGFQEAARAWAPQLYFNQSGPMNNRLYMQNRNFRVALSIAMNRDEINEVLYQGLAVPWNVAPRPGQTGFVEGLGTLYTEYDPDTANALLDQMGLAERDAGGFRIGPDGNRVSLVVLFEEEAEPAETMEMIANYWEQAGIEILLRPTPQNEMYNQRAEPTWDIIGWYGEAGGFYLTRFDKWLPGALISTQGWNEYILSDGAEGEVPPPHAVHFRNTFFQEVLQSSSEEELNEKFQSLMRQSVYNLWTTLTLHAPSAGHQNKDLRNVRWEGVSIEASNHYARMQTYWWDR